MTSIVQIEAWYLERANTYIWKGRTLWLCPPEMKLVWGSYIYLWLVKSPMGKILTSAGGPGGSPTWYLVNRGIWHPQKSTLGQKTFNRIWSYGQCLSQTPVFSRFWTSLALFFLFWAINHPKMVRFRAKLTFYTIRRTKTGFLRPYGPENGKTGFFMSLLLYLGPI